MNNRFWKAFGQRLLGGVLLVGTIIGIIASEGDAGFALLTIPMGLYCLLGKDVFDD